MSATCVLVALLAVLILGIAIATLLAYMLGYSD